jgi:SSS family solute:Na+ symporter
MFSFLDALVLFLYLFFSLALGIWVSRGKKTLQDYMLGGASMPWAAVGISLIATSISATTFLGAPADVYGADMTFLMFQIGAFLSIFVIGYVFIPQFKKSGVQSAYELFETRFSKSTRRLAAIFYSMHLLLRTGILLYAPSLVLSSILGFDIRVSITIAAGIAIFYTWFGGIKAVIWTDVLQFIVFFGGGLFVFIIIAQSVGGFSNLIGLASAHGKTKFFDPSLDPSSARTLISAGFAYAILEIAIRGGDQQFVQRYLSCKTAKEANYSSILSMVLGLVVSILFYWIGAALYVYYSVSKVQNLAPNTGINEVFPHFIIHSLPSGLTGLVVAAIAAAAMSSLSSAINSLSHTTENDILCKADNEHKSLRRAKLWTLLWGLLGILAAFFAATQQGSLLKNALFFTGLFTGPLLAMFILAFFTKKMQSFAVIPAVICGMFSLLLFHGIPFLKITGPLENILSWPWMPLVSLCVTLIIANLIHFISIIISQITCKSTHPTH